MKKEKKKLVEKHATKRDDKEGVIEYNGAAYLEELEDFMDTVDPDARTHRFNLSEFVSKEGKIIIPIKALTLLMPVIKDDKDVDKPKKK